jgi:hypothetical protein
MKLGFAFCAVCVVVFGCDRGETDIGDLPAGTDSESGGEETGSTGETGSTTTPVDCNGDGENCLDGCCDGFGCNFANLCEACTPEGEIRSVDGSGCCEGLANTPAALCYDAMCDGSDGMCSPDTICAGLDPAIAGIADWEGYIRDCAPEVCLTERTLTLADAPGLQCTGPGGSADCAATGGALQQFVHESDALDLTLSFDAAILDGYSTQAFNDHFDGVAGQLVIPDLSAPVTAFVETGTVSDLVYADGRLQFTIMLQLDNPFAIIESDAEDCLLDDIAGECACYYDPLGFYEIVVDLPIESP